MQFCYLVREICHIKYKNCLSIGVHIHFTKNEFHQILDAFVRIIFVRLLDHAVAQQRQDFVLGDETVTINVIDAETKLDVFRQRATQKHRQTENKALATNRLHIMVLFPGNENAVHQSLIDDEVECGVKEFTETVAINALLDNEMVYIISNYNFYDIKKY